MCSWACDCFLGSQRVLRDGCIVIKYWWDKMECLSLTLATSSKPCSDSAFTRFHSVSMMGSSLILHHPFHSFSFSFRGATVGQRIQGVPPFAAVGEATLSAETTLNSSTPHKKLLGSEDLHIKEEFNQADWSLDHPPHVLIPVANGSDEIEIVTIVDILRRAKVNVVIASVEKSLQILACQGTKILADKSIRMAAESTYDLIILPGGLAGVKKLSKSKVLKKLLKEQEAADRILGALCSSPELLQSQGLLMDKRITAHPSIQNKLTCKVVDGVKVVIDGQLITSKGLATTTDFALAIVTKLFGHGRARSVAEGLVFEYPRS